MREETVKTPYFHILTANPFPYPSITTHKSTEVKSAHNLKQANKTRKSMALKQ